VTAAFNLNLLARINRELDGDFDLAYFEHVARINHQTRSVEMHLRSMRTNGKLPGVDLAVEFLEAKPSGPKAATSILPKMFYKWLARWFPL